MLVQEDTNKLRNVAGIVATLVWLVSFVHALLIRSSYLDLKGGDVGPGRPGLSHPDSGIKRVGWGLMGLLFAIVGLFMLGKGIFHTVEIFELRKAPDCLGGPGPGCLAVVDAQIRDAFYEPVSRGPDEFHLLLRLPSRTESVELAYRDDSAAFDQVGSWVRATIWKGRVIALESGVVTAPTSEEPAAASIRALTEAPLMLLFCFFGVMKARGIDDLRPPRHRRILGVLAIISMGLVFSWAFAVPRPGTVLGFVLASAAISALYLLMSSARDT